MHIGQTIRRLRIRAGLKQNELARMAGTSKSYLCEIEHGNRTPGMVVIGKLAHAFGVPASRLMAVWEEDQAGDQASD